MKVPKDFMQDIVEVDVQDLGPVDGNWLFVPVREVREAAKHGRQGMRHLDRVLREKMKYSGEGVVVISVPLVRWVEANGWPCAGFAVAVVEDDGGVYIQPQDTLPDPSTRIAEA